MTAAGSGIADPAGNLLGNQPSTSFVVDKIAPTATITPVSPSLHDALPISITIGFSESISGFDLSDLKLTRDGGTNLLTAAQTLSTTDKITRAHVGTAGT